MKVTLHVWKQRVFLMLFFLFAALALTSSIASTSTLPNLADFINHLAGIIQAKMAMQQGQFPLRITPLEQSGWQYPYYQFYATTTYTLAGLVYWLLSPSNPLLAYKLVILFALVVAGLYMYQLAYWFIQSKPAAILAGIVYLTSPYYIIVVNRLGSLSETLALAIVPAFVYYTVQRFTQPNTKNFLQTSLIWYLLITIHLVTFVYTALFTGLLILLLTLRSPHNWRNLVALSLAIFAGLMLAAWFIVPVFLLGKYFFLGVTYNTPDHVNFFHPLLSYLLSPSALISSEYRNALLKLHPGVGWPIIFGGGLCLYGYCYKLKSDNTRADYLLPLLLILFAAAFFMVWSPVNFWKLLPPPLMVAQYSWRLLAQVSWIGALLFAWGVSVLYKNRLDISHVILGTFLIFLAGSQWLPGINNSPMNLPNFIKKPTFIYNLNSYAIDGNNHPEFVAHTRDMQAHEIFSVKQMEAGCIRGKKFTTCNLYATPNLRLVQLPILYYPNMLDVRINNKKIEPLASLYQNSLLASIEPISNQWNKIEFRFTGLQWANDLSCTAWIAWCLMLLVLCARHIWVKAHTH